LSDHLEQTLPAQAWPKERIASHVDEALKLAKDLGLKREVDVARFVAIATAFPSLDPEQLPKDVFNALNAYGVAPEEKLKREEAIRGCTAWVLAGRGGRGGHCVSGGAGKERQAGPLD